MAAKSSMDWHSCARSSINQKCDLFDAYLYTIKNNKLEAVLFYVVQICQGRNQYLP